jgi:hypothetical protein
MIKQTELYRELSTAFFMIDNVHEVHRMISEQIGR